MNRVFVLDGNKRPLMPCRPARARLLDAGKAAVYRLVPFTLVLKDREGGAVQPVELKAGPGSRTTGLALVAEFSRGREVMWAGELVHRGLPIRAALDKRRALRRGRRSRKTRYRAPRFDNRTRPAGWLPPSLQSRVGNTAAWGRKLQALAPLSAVAVETARFDTQAMEHLGITGVEYQQGTLAGYEVREYVLEHWDRKCAYCGTKNVPLEAEHIVPRSQGGSDRVSNLTLACVPCNRAKGNRPLAEFLAHDPDRLRRIQAHTKAPLKDAAAVNATRYVLGNALKTLGLPTSFWSRGRTKFNRGRQSHPKAHWVDAACVGESGVAVALDPAQKPLVIKAKDRGRRQGQRTDRFGFPRGKAGRVKQVRGFRTGDRVRLTRLSGKYAGVHVGRLAGLRADGRFDIKTPAGKITSSWRNFTLIQKNDGYDYA